MGALDALLVAIGGGLRIGGTPLERLLCDVLGRIGWAPMGPKRRVAHTNLALVYGAGLDAPEAARIVRRMFVHVVHLGLDFIFDWVYWPRGVRSR